MIFLISQKKNYPPPSLAASQRYSYYHEEKVFHIIRFFIALHLCFNFCWFCQRHTPQLQNTHVSSPANLNVFPKQSARNPHLPFYGRFVDKSKALAFKKCAVSKLLFGLLDKLKLHPLKTHTMLLNKVSVYLCCMLDLQSVQNNKFHLHGCNP